MSYHIKSGVVPCRIRLFPTSISKIKKLGLESRVGTLTLKGSPGPSQFISEINVGKKRIRHITTLNLKRQSIWVDQEIHQSISESLCVGSVSFRH